MHDLPALAPTFDARRRRYDSNPFRWVHQPTSLEQDLAILQWPAKGDEQCRA